MSKLMTEVMLKDVSRVTSLSHVALRYFNVAGSAPDGRIGQSTPDCTLLIKVACETALGKRRQMQIYGTDYPTPDGTGIRDYIHVSDLAAAHILALKHLETGGDSLTLNCGYGHGYSVREVVRAAEQVHGRSIPVTETDRRPGDPPFLVADGSSTREALGWHPRYDDLEFIIRTSYNWEKKPPLLTGQKYTLSCWQEFIRPCSPRLRETPIAAACFYPPALVSGGHILPGKSARNSARR